VQSFRRFCFLRPILVTISHSPGGPLRSSNTVVFCAIDDFLPLPGKPLSGFLEFLDSLSQSSIPCVWVSSRNRHQLDASFRKFGRGEPFIAEGGSCVYLAEDYFHLKPARTVRLGRFIAIPIAKAQPAAAEALEILSQQSGITVVPLRSLSPRELMQNTGLPRSEAEATRQRDFDELFFFAGASENDIGRFRERALQQRLLVRSRPDGLWSIAVEASLASCVRELQKLYARAFHRPAFAFALATSRAPEYAELFSSSDRAVLLRDRTESGTEPSLRNARVLPLFHPDSWTEAFQLIERRQF